VESKDNRGNASDILRGSDNDVEEGGSKAIASR
jgi:hypothetical protein